MCLFDVIDWDNDVQDDIVTDIKIEPSYITYPDPKEGEPYNHEIPYEKNQKFLVPGLVYVGNTALGILGGNKYQRIFDAVVNSGYKFYARVQDYSPWFDLTLDDLDNNEILHLCESIALEFFFAPTNVEIEPDDGNQEINFDSLINFEYHFHRIYDKNANRSSINYKIFDPNIGEIKPIQANILVKYQEDKLKDERYKPIYFTFTAEKRKYLAYMIINYTTVYFGYESHDRS